MKYEATMVVVGTGRAYFVVLYLVLRLVVLSSFEQPIGKERVCSFLISPPLST